MALNSPSSYLYIPSVGITDVPYQTLLEIYSRIYKYPSLYAQTYFNLNAIALDFNLVFWLLCVAVVCYSSYLYQFDVKKNQTPRRKTLPQFYPVLAC